MIKNRFAQYEDKIDWEIPSATNMIYEFIEENLNKKRENATDVNRASAATMCPKRRWYQRRGDEGTPLTPRKIVNFALGDLSEKTLLHFIREGCVGPGKLYSEVDFGMETGSFTIQNGFTVRDYTQGDLHTKAGDIEIVGHPDGIGKRNSDGKWELIEIKSSANYGFSKFKDEGAGDYLNQAHVLMMSEELQLLGVKDVRFYYLRKETGHVWDILHHFDEKIWAATVEGYRISNQETLPTTPFELERESKWAGKGKPRKFTGLIKAGFPCSYCPYLDKCHPGLTKEFKKGFDGTISPAFTMVDPDFKKEEK